MSNLSINSLDQTPFQFSREGFRRRVIPPDFLIPLIDHQPQILRGKPLKGRMTWGNEEYGLEEMGECSCLNREKDKEQIKLLREKSHDFLLEQSEKKKTLHIAFYGSGWLLREFTLSALLFDQLFQRGWSGEISVSLIDPIYKDQKRFFHTLQSFSLFLLRCLSKKVHLNVTAYTKVSDIPEENVPDLGVAIDIENFWPSLKKVTKFALRTISLRKSGYEAKIYEFSREVESTYSI